MMIFKFNFYKLYFLLNIMEKEPVLGMKYSFISTIYYILIKANSRIHWDPEDLITVGMVIRDLNKILEKYNPQIEESNQVKNETKVENKKVENKKVEDKKPKSKTTKK